MTRRLAAEISSRRRRSAADIEASITACAVTSDQVILTGQSGEIFHSADHGRTFRGVEINADAPILDLLPLEEEKVLVVGMRGKQIIEVAK